jgi:hypothetical protein
MAQSKRFFQTSKLIDAVNLTRLLVVASVAGPAIIFGLIAWFTYQSAFAGAQRELAWTSDVAREHASKVFDSYKLVADRVQDLLDHVPDSQIRSAERAYYDNFRKVVEGLPQIESFIVLDRDGHLLVATADFPFRMTPIFRTAIISSRSGTGRPIPSSAWFKPAGSRAPRFSVGAGRGGTRLVPSTGSSISLWRRISSCGFTKLLFATSGTAPRGAS